MKGIVEDALQVVTNYEEDRRQKMIKSAVDYGMRFVEQHLTYEQMKTDLEVTARCMQMGEAEFGEFVQIVKESINTYSYMVNGLNYQVTFNNDNE